MGQQQHWPPQPELDVADYHFKLPLWLTGLTDVYVYVFRQDGRRMSGRWPEGMKKGKHKKRRVGENDPEVVVGKYAQRDPTIPKTCITLYLDNDVLAYFKHRAAQRHAAPYQAQINNELRAVMEREATGRVSQYEASLVASR